MYNVLPNEQKSPSLFNSKKLEILEGFKNNVQSQSKQVNEEIQIIKNHSHEITKKKYEIILKNYEFNYILGIDKKEKEHMELFGKLLIKELDFQML